MARRHARPACPHRDRRPADRRPGLRRGPAAASNRLQSRHPADPLELAASSATAPTPAKRKGVAAPLRLDTPEGATADLGGYAAIVRGKPEESELIERITTDDSTEVMPPPKHGKRLSPREVEILTEWVRQGAPYAKHWSYVEAGPTAAARTSKRQDWPRNADRSLRPGPPRARRSQALARGRSLRADPPRQPRPDRPAADARGGRRLRQRQRHPTPTNSSSTACWRGRPTASTGRRLWLDLARYADSAGYADDPPRTIWAYRDYVIRSFNANKPFDQFTIEQIAGDLLPEPDRRPAHRDRLPPQHADQQRGRAPTTRSSATSPSSTA